MSTFFEVKYYTLPKSCKLDNVLYNSRQVFLQMTTLYVTFRPGFFRLQVCWLFQVEKLKFQFKIEHLFVVQFIFIFYCILYYLTINQQVQANTFAVHLKYLFKSDTIILDGLLMTFCSVKTSQKMLATSPVSVIS